MKISIVRHAIALEQTQWQQDDAKRPLSRKGRERFTRSLPALGRLLGDTTALWSSPWKRAYDTARYLSKTLEVEITPVPELTKGRWPQVPALLQTRVDTLSHVILVGHNPDLTQLLAWFLNLPESHLVLKKGGAAGLTCSSPAQGGAVLHWFAPPRLLRL